MEDAYFILRNNQEKGLFNLHELIEFPLQPDDLIWVVGKSTSWKFPTEIENLKPYIKPTLQQEKVGIFSLSQNNLFPTGTQIPKPYVYVQLPQKKTNTITEEKTEPDEITAEKLEQKANELYQRVMIFEKQKEEKKDIDKSTRMQAMKDEFGKWKERVAKRKKYSYRKKWALSAGFTGIAATGIFLLMQPNTLRKSQPLMPEHFYIKKEATPLVVSTPNLIQTISYSPKENENLNEDISNAVPSSVDKFIDSVENVLAKHDKHYKKNTHYSVRERKQ